MQTFTLNNGVEMPRLGLGVYRSTGDETVRVVRSALEKGYRLIDTATAYGNEAQVGEGIRQSGLARAELFVTTKLFLADYGYEGTLRAFDQSLSRLGLDYLDLYLLHWPVPREFDATLASWQAMEKLLAEGRLRAIGVCNFNPDHLRRLRENSQTVPALNQIELHPYFSQSAVREANWEEGVLTQAWSPIGGVKRYWAGAGAAVHDSLNDEVIKALAVRHGKSPAQIILRWHIENGVSVIPKSSRDERLMENIDIFDFHLSPQEIAAIDALNCDERGGPDPEVNDLQTIRARLAAKDR